MRETPRSGQSPAKPQVDDDNTQLLEALDELGTAMSDLAQLMTQMDELVKATAPGDRQAR